MIAVFSAVSFFAVKKYRELESIMDAKRIHEKLKQQKYKILVDNELSMEIYHLGTTAFQNQTL